MKNYLLLIPIYILVLQTGCKKSEKNNPQSQSPTIASFTPKSANAGETITITGAAFGTDANSVTVKFGSSVGVKPSAVSETNLTVNGAEEFY